MENASQSAISGRVMQPMNFISYICISLAGLLAGAAVGALVAETYMVKTR
jgi:hypothetical protein